VAERALGDGASVVNSVSLEPARELGELCGRHGASLVLMHCRGSMTDMQGFSTYADDAYGDVVADVAREWQAAAARSLESMPKDDLVFDPGLGFAKNARQSMELCGRLGELVALKFPVLAGPSRKSFLARAGQRSGDEPLAPPDRRLGATIVACLACADAGAAILRVHDVEEVAQALTVARALRAPRKRRADA
jgi:dihydropteroate synthase